MDTSLFIAASVAVNRFVDFLKPYVRKLPYSADIQDALLLLIACASGVLLAFSGQLNLFTVVPNIPPFVATVLTGVLCGFGADVINVVVSLLYNWKDANKPAEPTATITSARWAYAPTKATGPQVGAVIKDGDIQPPAE